MLCAGRMLQFKIITYLYKVILVVTFVLWQILLIFMGSFAFFMAFYGFLLYMLDIFSK